MTTTTLKSLWVQSYNPIHCWAQQGLAPLSNGPRQAQQWAHLWGRGQAHISWAKVGHSHNLQQWQSSGGPQLPAASSQGALRFLPCVCIHKHTKQSVRVTQFESHTHTQKDNHELWKQMTHTSV